jgi:probable phosphoglycerate mutase
LELPLSAYWRIPQQPCCINRIQLGSDGLARVQTLNDTAHLKDLE